MFGGLIEVTKESDEVFSYNVSTNTWTLIDTSGEGHGYEDRSPTKIPMMDHKESANDESMLHSKGLATTKKTKAIS